MDTAASSGVISGILRNQNVCDMEIFKNDDFKTIGPYAKISCKRYVNNMAMI